MDRASLDRLQRPELIELARSRGVERPEVMTRDELIDEILRLGASDPGESKSVRGWFGVARDLLAGLVEQGLHLPDAAKVIRGDGPGSVPSHRRPLATVTLAEIYAAQGHLARGVAVLQEVLEKEPEHEVARRLLSELEARAASDAAEYYPEEADAWSEAAPVTPAESPSAISADERATPVVSYLESANHPLVNSPSAVEVNVKPEQEPEAPTLRTTQLSEELPVSDPEPEEDTSPEASNRPLVTPVASLIPEDTDREVDLREVESSSEVADEPHDTLEMPADLEDAPGDLESPDSCVLFAADGRVVLSWRLAETSFAKRLEQQPNGAPIVRLVWWAPGLPASRSSLDVAVTQTSGELLVEPQAYSLGASLRGALGWLDGESGEFVVLATAIVCSLEETLDTELLFRPHSAAPAPPVERLEAARALVQRYA